MPHKSISRRFYESFAYLCLCSPMFYQPNHWFHEHLQKSSFNEIFLGLSFQSNMFHTSAQVNCPQIVSSFASNFRILTSLLIGPFGLWRPNSSISRNFLQSSLTMAHCKAPFCPISAQQALKGTQNVNLTEYFSTESSVV